MLQRLQPDGTTQYFTSSATNPPVDTKILKEFHAAEGKWKSFDEYVQWSYGTWVITVDSAEESATCTCPYYMKHVTCKHSRGMLLRLKLVQAPAEARTVPLGQKRKRGRPSKAKRALIVQ